MSRIGAECPYCHHINDPEKQEAWELYDENTEEFDCTWCLSKFKVDVIVTYTWVTEKLDQDVDVETIQ